MHIELIGTNVWLPKMQRIPPDVDFESSRSPAKSESWNNTNLQCCAVFPTCQYCLNSLVWWVDETKRDNRLSQALVHFEMDRAVCSLTIEYQVVQYVPNTSISEQFESIFLAILSRIPCLLPWLGGRQCMVLPLQPCARMIWILNDMSDSAMVLESISSSSTINLSVCSVNKGWLFIDRTHRAYFHHFIRFPLLRRPLFVSIPLWVTWWVSVLKKSPCS